MTERSRSEEERNERGEGKGCRADPEGSLAGGGDAIRERGELEGTLSPVCYATCFPSCFPNKQDVGLQHRHASAGSACVKDV